MNEWRVVEWVGRKRHVRTLAVRPSWNEAVEYAEAVEHTEDDATGRRVIGWIPADAMTCRGATFRPNSTATLKVVR